MEKFVDFITRGKSSIILPFILLLFSCILFEITDLDLYIQDYFFDAQTQSWVFNFKDENSIAVFIYHKLLKGFVILFAVALLTRIIRAAIKHTETPERIKKMIYVFVVLAVIPGAVGAIKHQTNMPYPYKIHRYGGPEYRRTLFEAFSGKPLPSGSGRTDFHGWPGGHSSAGFALLGLGFAFADRKKRLKGFLFATFYGFLLGMCHTVDGNHFFSHNLASWFIGWFLAAVTYKLFFKTANSHQPTADSRETLS